ncbi:hypothetical protein [Siphonobacter sp. SORGH_AS_0500]|uniref:hypothetical protein n=1 Tax=Siphonobacter sp. SORGH_AS_0500 TaxID=1864824 RepID=UPI00286A372D|nr:hypothetical protein [Siphonobacter sp. SORGH_AS_0500]
MILHTIFGVWLLIISIGISGVILHSTGSNRFSFIIQGTDATNNVYQSGICSYRWNQQADAIMLQRIEFVKGPAGFIIGHSELGGIVNGIVKQANGHTIRETEMGYASWNLLQSSLAVKGEFSIHFIAPTGPTTSVISFGLLNYSSIRRFTTALTQSTNFRFVTSYHF